MNDDEKTFLCVLSVVLALVAVAVVLWGFK
jgi:nitrogen fixation-related uncharacterized protein